MDTRERIARTVAGWISGRDLFAVVKAVVDDSPGWSALTGLAHERPESELSTLYTDALQAWRKNPLAWRVISITSDFVLGDWIRISSPYGPLNEYIQRFWNHRKNRMDLRLEPMCDELSRAGDLFVLLFRNRGDGMSYIRFLTKDRIVRIETVKNDWETELVYFEKGDTGESRRWYSPNSGRVRTAKAICLHYAINRPVGALMGEGDLTTVIPWLLRYSRMLEDRVRLHWATRAFLWLVTVPTNRIKEKSAQYAKPPDTGSIVVKDEGESWEPVNPRLQGLDASYDMKAVRGMVDAGSGYPPHWRGEAWDVNLATAQAMQGPSERHLLRRQNHFVHLLEDILYHGYQRAVEIDKAPPLPSDRYAELFKVDLPDITRRDNAELAGAARELADALDKLGGMIPGKSKTWTRKALELVMKFAGEGLDQDELRAILEEGWGEVLGDKENNRKE